MKNFDTFEIDFRPGIRRANGGVIGFSRNLMCRGDLGSSKSSNTSKAYNYQTTVQGGGSGSGTVAVGAGSSNNTIDISTVDPEVVGAAFNFAAESQTENAQTIGQSDQTIQNIAGTLADLTANATPQSEAAQDELLNGGSPVSPASIPNNIVVIGTIAVVGVAAVIFFVTRKQ